MNPRALRALAALTLLPACAPGPDASDDVSFELPERDIFVTEGLAAHAGSRAGLRAHLGEPDAVEREVVANRHVPGIVDTLVTLTYPDLVARFHVPGGGGELLSSARVGGNRHLAHPLIGAAPARVEAAFGPPDERSDSSFSYRCVTCAGADEPVELLVQNGRVDAVRFHLYVD